MAGLACVAALLPMNLSAQGIPVTVGVGAIESGAGAFDLPITVDMSARAEMLGSFVLMLRWNPNVLQFQGGVAGTFGDLTVNEDSSAAGVLRLAGANPGGVGGLITLGVGRFSVLTNDTTTFRVSVQELYAAGTFADLTPDAVALDRLFCGAFAGTWGDVNSDGAVNGADALIVLTESVGLDVSQFAMGFGDVDSSGARNPRDALIILSYAVGINTASFRVGLAVGGAVCTPPGAQSYAMNPSTAEALVGQEVAYFVFGLDSTGAALALRNVTWASSNGTVASVDGAGYATALAAGTATITALQNDTTVASGTLTVLAGRRTHWVDALAVNARNQLGSSAHPFEDIGTATALAAAGDTVRVRPGRYEPFTVMRAMVVLGDSAPDGALPVIDAPGVPDAHGTIADAPGGTVELRRLRYGTIYLPIEIGTVDTMRIRDVQAAPGPDAYAGIWGARVGVLHIERSVVAGQGSELYTANAGVRIFNADSVVLDSTVVSDFTGAGVQLDSVGAVVVRGSMLRYNQGSGLAVYNADSANAARIVVSGSRITGNGYTGVLGSYVASAAFDHNVFDGGGISYGEGIYLTGTRGSVITSLADSMDMRQASWLQLYGFDSLLVDSVEVVSGGYGASVNDGRVVVLRNGRHTITNYDGFYVSGRGPDSTVVIVRNERFDGLSQQTYYGGYGIEGYNAALDVEASSFSNLYYGIETGYGGLAVRRSSFTNSYYAINGYCSEAPINIDSVQINSSYYGIWGSTCGAAGVDAQVDSVDLRRASQGMQFDSFRRVAVRQSRVMEVDDGIAVSYSDTVRVDTVDVAALYTGIDLYGDTVAAVTGTTAACGSDGYGIDVESGRRASVAGNTVTGACRVGIYLASGVDTAEVRGNTISSTGYYGMQAYATNAGSRVAIVGNTVTGPHPYGSLYLYGSQTVATGIRVDSNVIANGVDAGVYVNSGDTVRVRDNTISGIGSLAGYLANEAAIIVEANTSLRGLLDIRRNRLSGNVSGILINRQLADTLVAATVDSNRIYGSTLDGIRVLGYTRVLAQRNVIDSVGRDAVRVDRSIVGDTLQVRLLGNNFTRSGVYGVNNLDGGLIDARTNWWGDALGPAGTAGEPASTGDSVSAGVLWAPPLAAPAGDVLPPAPPFAAFVASLATQPRVTAPTSAVTLPRRAPTGAVDMPLPQAARGGAVSPEARARWERQQAEWRAREATRIARQERAAALDAERTARRTQRREERP